MYIYRHLPIGVLYDCCDTQDLPWKLTIHFLQHHGEQCMRLNTIQDGQRLLSHSLKQATYLIHGNTRPFTSLTIKEHEQLTQALQSGIADEYEEVVKDIRDGVVPRTVPLRIVVPGKPICQRHVEVYATTNELQSTEGNSGQLITLREVCDSFLPSLKVIPR